MEQRGRKEGIVSVSGGRVHGQKPSHVGGRKERKGSQMGRVRGVGQDGTTLWNGYLRILIILVSIIVTQ